MHVEIGFDLAPLLLEQHREQKVWTEPASKRGQQASASAGSKFPGRVPVLGKKIGPHHDVAVLDVRQTCVDILLLWIRLGGAEETVQVRRIRFILPVVLERVYV